MSKLSNDTRNSIIEVLDGNNVIISSDMNYGDKLSIYTTKTITNLQKEEEILHNNLK